MASSVDQPPADGFAEEPGVAARFRPIFNPATREWIRFSAIPEDGGEDLVRFDWRSLPGGAITEHFHPHQEERFTITAGKAHFTVEGEDRVVGAGEAIVVPRGARHSERNLGSVAIEGVVELRPGLNSRQFHEAFAALGAAGETDSRGAPKNPFQLGATVWHFRQESRVTVPPPWVQALVLPPLWALAPLLGVRPYHEDWDSRLQDPDRDPGR
jgi:quercetin dioxygenase-like cupin family protein